jgi:hypothetical protein
MYCMAHPTETDCGAFDTGSIRADAHTVVNRTGKSVQMGNSMMLRSHRLAAVTVLAVALAVGLAACGSDDSQSDGSATQPTASTAATAQPTTTDAASTGQPAEVAQLENGRHPVLLERVDMAGRTVTLDLVQWFIGDAATKAAAEDGEESPPPNDYYIRNVNPRLRTLPLAPGAHLTLTRQTLAQGGDATGAVEVDLAKLATSGRKHLFWATVQAGRILRLEEQYLP